MDATKLANELIELHDHPRLVAPFSARYPGLTPETGYAAARRLHAHRLAQGWRLVGRKNGFTNRGIWERYGVDGPMWGAVYDRTLQWAGNGTTAVSLAGLTQPRIEPEICFKLKAVPPRSRNPAELLAAIAPHREQGDVFLLAAKVLREELAEKAVHARRESRHHLERIFPATVPLEGGIADAGQVRLDRLNLGRQHARVLSNAGMPPGKRG